MPDSLFFRCFMCMFPFPNKDFRSLAYRKGIHEFECGCCPECLAKRARLWALRASAEAVNNIGCMITLTYDDYKYDRSGRAVGELPVNGDLPLSKRHCQLFIKRLRAHFKGIKIKYLLTAERGKRTNRAHYHAILFGVQFDDKIFYKKSDRGNIIYKSRTLSKLWGHGICTIDCININAQVARYCTKYCAKDSRADDSFMLVSRGIGDKWLEDNFNGKSYFLDGREYTIPKLIWNKKIAFFYRNNYIFNLRNCTYKYRGLSWYIKKFGDTLLATHFADYNARQRINFRAFRDSNPLYKAYLKYWKDKNDLINLTKPSVFERICALDDKKYFAYKQRALECLLNRKTERFAFEAENLHLPPRYLSNTRKIKALDKLFRICPQSSCHKRANDSLDQKKRFRNFIIDNGLRFPLPKLEEIPQNVRLISPF